MRTKFEWLFRVESRVIGTILAIEATCLIECECQRFVFKRVALIITFIHVIVETLSNEQMKLNLISY